MPILWPLSSMRQVSDASAAASSAASTAREANRSLRQLQDQVDRLTIISWAMWTLIQEETKLTEEDLMERVKNLDMLDGTEDGKVTRQVARCRKCDRVMSPRHQSCIYCGAEKLTISAFDSVT